MDSPRHATHVLVEPRFISRRSSAAAQSCTSRPLPLVLREPHAVEWVLKSPRTSDAQEDRRPSVSRKLRARPRRRRTPSGWCWATHILPPRLGRPIWRPRSLFPARSPSRKGFPRSRSRIWQPSQLGPQRPVTHRAVWLGHRCQTNPPLHQALEHYVLGPAGAVKIALQEQLSSSSSSAHVRKGSVSIASLGPFPSHSVHPTSPSSFLAFPGPVDGGVVFFLVAASPASPGTVLASYAALFLRVGGLHTGDPMWCDAGSPRSAHIGHLLAPSGPWHDVLLPRIDSSAPTGRPPTCSPCARAPTPCTWSTGAVAPGEGKPSPLTNLYWSYLPIKRPLFCWFSWPLSASSVATPTRMGMGNPRSV